MHLEMNGYALATIWFGATAAGFLGSIKGRSFPLWAALGAVFPLISIIVVLVLKPVTTTLYGAPKRPHREGVPASGRVGLAASQTRRAA